MTEHWTERRRREKEEFAEWLRSHDHIEEVDERRNTIDFIIGDMLEDYPKYSNEDELRMVGRSSVSAGGLDPDAGREDLFVAETAIHLPAAREELEEEIESYLDLPDPFVIHYGSRQFGGIPAPDGVITPHVQVTEDTTFENLKTTIGNLTEIYEQVYGCGDNAILKKP